MALCLARTDEIEYTTGEKSLFLLLSSSPSSIRLYFLTHCALVYPYEVKITGDVMKYDDGNEGTIVYLILSLETQEFY